MKSPYLGRGVLQVLKDYGKVNLAQIAEYTGWTRKQVYDEVRRLMNNSVLSLWITETTIGTTRFYELDHIMRNGVTVDCLNEMAKKTFDFSSKYPEKVKKLVNE